MGRIIEGDISFKPKYIDESDSGEKKFYFVFNEQSILLRNEGGRPVIPDETDVAAMGIERRDRFYFGDMNDCSCYVILLDEEVDLPENLRMVNLRAIYGTVTDDLFWIAGRAFHLGSWNSTHKFCGSCGGRTELKTDDISKVCTKCGSTVFPRISPAVIMAVIKDGKILLAHNNRWKNPMYSTLAGFVDVGESLEECVMREVKEEAGIDVKNIKYFGCQPWHFTGSLMIGFTAEYAGGELKLDSTELKDGGWYSKDDLPPVIARKPSIARQLIDWFVETYQK